MKTLRKFRFISLTLIVSLLVITAMPTMSMAAQATVNLGTTSTFAILAGTTITNTGPTVINGDAGGNVGLYAGSAFTGQDEATISGAVNINNPAAITAKHDLETAYDDAAGRTPATIISSELGGQTLKPGVYKSDNGTSFQITGTLTLDGNNDPDPVFIFQMGTTLVTAVSSNVSLTNGAVYCRVFWQVGSSATLGVDSHFVGHIFALTSIAAQTGATVQGQLLARNGAVTLDSNTITNGFCAAAAATPTPTTAPGATAVPTTAPTATAVPTTATGATPVPTTGTTELAKTGENTQKQIMIGGLLLVISGSLVFLLVSRRKNIQR